jgi:hypothetical protein
MCLNAQNQSFGNAILEKNKDSSLFYESNTNTYLVYPNSFDSLTFDIVFDKATLNTDSIKLLQIDLYKKEKICFRKKYPIDQFMYTFLSNFPNCDSCFVIRLDFSKDANIISLKYERSEPYQLIITDITNKKSKQLYGQSPNDKFFKFAPEPYSEENK